MTNTLPVNVTDYESLARTCTDAAVWDFIAGGSEDEVTLAENRAAFRRFLLRPRVLTGVGAADVGATVLGESLTCPIMVAPIGYQGLVHADGECAAARVAGAFGTVMVVSTMSNRTLEDIAAASSGPLWFQLYVMKDRGLTRSLIQRAEAAGFRALVVTVDAPRLGRRERDLRNGFALPEHLEPANLRSGHTKAVHEIEQGVSAIARHVLQEFDTRLSWETLSWILESTRLPVVLKGVLTAEDAERAVRAGVRGIIVSNHGGRQLDGAIPSLDALPEVAEAVGDRCELFLDGGIRRGTDILKARALGARAVLVGRPALWGLLARGEAGMKHVLDLLSAELEHAMVLAGCARWNDIDRTLVKRG